MIKHNITRFYKGSFVEKGDPVTNATDKAVQRMLDCGQAYEDIVKPTASNKKTDITLYLEAEGIDYSQEMTKDELLELI